MIILLLSNSYCQQSNYNMRYNNNIIYILDEKYNFYLIRYYEKVNAINSKIKKEYLLTIK